MYNTQKTVELIKQVAKARHTSIGQMLSDCGLSKNALSSMQSRGSWLQANNLAKIADYLDCSVDYLLGRTDCPDLMVKDKDGNTAFIEIMRTQNVYKAKIAASDGSFNKEVTLTDSDLEKLSTLPDVNDI